MIFIWHFFKPFCFYLGLRKVVTRKRRRWRNSARFKRDWKAIVLPELRASVVRLDETGSYQE